MREICDAFTELDSLHIYRRIDTDTYERANDLIETIFWLQSRIESESKRLREVSVKDLVRWIEEERAVGLSD